MNIFKSIGKLSYHTVKTTKSISKVKLPDVKKEFTDGYAEAAIEDIVKKKPVQLEMDL
jgi:hypothetical protein